jgi:glycosyltransferase involved in cell wall biosynthesis
MIAPGEQATVLASHQSAVNRLGARPIQVSSRTAPVRIAFVMEQTLGHVTHFRNLQDAVALHEHIAPTWLPIPFATDGAARLLPVFRSNWSVRASLRARRALRRALQGHDHDALVFHTQVTSLFSMDQMRRLPTVMSLDATPINYDAVGEPYDHRPAGVGLIDRQKHRLNREAFHCAAALVTWSDWARRSLIADYAIDPGRISVLAPGASAGYFRIGETRQTAFVRAVAQQGKVNVLFVGGDFIRKGGPLLLDVLHGDLAERCELHLATSDPVAERPGVHVHRGIAPNSDELLRLFAEADVFVLPSKGECLAVALMEATAAGLPVITTDVGALSEAVAPGESGIVIRPGDAGGLRHALDALAADPALRRRMGAAGHALAREKFDSHKNNRALLDLVVEAAAGASQARRVA